MKNGSSPAAQLAHQFLSRQLLWGATAAVFLFTFCPGIAQANHPKPLIGVWNVDHEILAGSAKDVAEAMGKPRMEKQLRAAMRSVVITLKLRPDGTYFFQAKVPKANAAATGTWNLSGLDIELKRKRGTPIHPRVIIIKGPDGPRIQLYHPVMKGMKIVLTRTSGPLQCNTDLSAYTKEAQGIIQGMLMDAASGYIYEYVVQSLQETNRMVRKLIKHRTTKKIVKRLLSKKIAKRFLRPLRQTLGMLGRNRNAVPALDFLRDVTTNITKAISILQVLEAASDGAYVEAATIAAVEAIGAYSTGAGIILAIGRAVKADWDAFAARVDEKFYREWYEEFYLGAGHRPSGKRARARSRQRLREFTNDILDTLSAGGVGGASRLAMAGVRPARLRRSLQLYANNKLEMSLSREDFQVVMVGGDPKFKKKVARNVVANLFWSFEQTFRKDVQTEIMRRAMLAQAKLNRDVTMEAGWAVSDAEAGNFEKVWKSKAAYKDTFCAIVQQAKEQLKGKGLLK